MESDAVHPVKQLRVQGVHMTVVGYMAVGHKHLAASYRCTHIAHAVIVAYLLMLVIRIAFACLGGKKHYPSAGLGIGAHQSSATRGGDHLVAVERQHAESSERAAFTTGILRPEGLGGILYQRNAVTFGHSSYTIHLRGHAVKPYTHYRLGLASGCGDAVGYGPVEQVGIHIPRHIFGVDKHRHRTEICHRIGRRTERKRLYHHLVAGAHPTCFQREVHGGSAVAKSHHLLATAHKLLEVSFKSVDCRAKRHNPVGVESFGHKLSLAAAHMIQAKMNAFSSHNFRRLFAETQSYYIISGYKNVSAMRLLKHAEHRATRRGTP